MAMFELLLLLALVLLASGLWLYLQARQQRQATGLPAGEVIYVDTGDWRRNDRPLFSSEHRLTGKPDYLVKDGRETIPIEIKSTYLQGNDPYDSHKLQLAAYCLLIENTSGKRPSYGILKYANATLRLPYTKALRKELLNTLDRIQEAQDARNILRSHQDPSRCRNCGYVQDCGNEALA